MGEEASIDFIFTVAKIESMADGAPRLTLDLTEHNLPEASMLWAAKLSKIVLKAHITQANTYQNMDKNTNEIEQGAEKQSKRVGRSRLDD